MTDTFTNPSTATGIDFKALNGSLLLISVAAVEEGIKTVHGDSSAIRANVVVLDGDSKGESIEDALIFPRVLQSQLRSNIGKKVLGRLGQGSAKPGQSPPWTLSEATDADKDAATRYLAYIADQHTAAPAPATAQPAPAAAAPTTPW